MTKAAFENSTPPRPAMVTPNFKRGLPTPAMPDLTPVDALRLIVDTGDYIGADADGGQWFLFAAPPHLAKYLEALDAAQEDWEDESDGGGYHGGTEDDEPNGDLEDDRSDFEPDSDGEPDFRRRPRLSTAVLIPEIRAGAVPPLPAAE